MGIYRDISALPSFTNTAITIGTFDGVHKGHRAILRELVAHARQTDGETVLVTFEPHPRKLLFPNQSLRLLTPIEQKLQLIQEAGIDHIVVAPFTRAFSELSAREYLEGFLVTAFRPSSIVIGYDHHFGHDRSGNIRLMEEMKDVYGYEVVEIPAQMIDEATVSSTKIRRALEEGRVHEAAQMLGRHYALSGTVYHGAKLGRTIGYPTANINPSDADQLIPANGIYAVYVTVGGQRYKGMLSIGFNPTVTSEHVLRIEVHIFEFAADIYEQELTLHFVEKLRDEQKFDSLEALTTQLHADQVAALGILA